MIEKDGGPAQSQMSEPVAMYRYGYYEQRNGETYTFWRLDPVCNGVKCDITQPLYASSYAQGVADAARIVGKGNGNNALYEAIRALTSPPSVTMAWVSKRIEDAYDKTRGNNEGDALAEDAVLATLAALGIPVEAK